MLTHRNMLAACASISTYLEIQSDEVILGALPLVFDYGLYQMIMAFAAGARLVLERSFAFPAQSAEGRWRRSASPASPACRRSSRCSGSSSRCAITTSPASAT